MFDNICKFLVENFSSDFARWLLGKSLTFTELSPSELSLEPIRADALILLEAEEIVLHLEFQTQPKTDIPFRMIDYRLRVYCRFPFKQMHQVVIYLRQSASELAQQTTFILEKTRHEFEVIRLWEQLTSIFLQYPGLLPFAVLSQTSNRIGTLQQVAQEIIKIPDQRVQNNVAASAFILAGLVLEKDIVQQVLRRELMQESVTYQALVEEGRAEGRAEGRVEGRAEGLQEGIHEGIRSVATNLLREGIAVEMVARVTGLSVEVVQQLASDLGGGE